MLALAAALSCAVSWGAADFVGGLQSRRIPATAVLFGSSVTGVMVVAVILVISGHGPPPASDIGFAVLAGVIGLVALSCFYKALAIGTMSIVAPVSASGIVFPVVVGLATGDELTVPIGAGFACTVTGVMLAAREPVERVAGIDPEPPDSNARRATLLALVAAAGFGTLYILIERASRNEQFWSVLLQKGVPMVVIAVVIAVWHARGNWQPVARNLWLATIVVGLLDTAALSAYAYASTHGPLSVTAVLAAMFPVFTILLAHQFLGERIVRAQKSGVVLALAGVALLAST